MDAGKVVYGKLKEKERSVNTRIYILIINLKSKNTAGY
jgi:hypothetical protein